MFFVMSPDTLLLLLALTRLLLLLLLLLLPPELLLLVAFARPPLELEAPLPAAGRGMGFRLASWSSSSSLRFGIFLSTAGGAVCLEEEKEDGDEEEEEGAGALPPPRDILTSTSSGATATASKIERESGAPVCSISALGELLARVAKDELASSDFRGDFSYDPRITPACTNYGPSDANSVSGIQLYLTFPE